MLLCLFLLTLASSDPEGAGRSSLIRKLTPLVLRGCVLVADDQRAHFRFPEGCNPKLTPASVLKIATAAMALEKLGPGFRFRTEFFLSGNNSLGIRGHGDPFLVSEEWNQIAQNLAALKNFPRKLNSLFVDGSLFGDLSFLPGPGRSLNPYDAPNGALISNFNTIYVRKLKDGTVQSAEPQTPLTPSTRRWARSLQPGIQRIRIPEGPDNAAVYSAELLRFFLRKQGVIIKEDKIQTRETGPDDTLVYRHLNRRNLKETIAGMMLYSNNFIANQLLLSAGMREQGPPAVPEKGLKMLRTYFMKNLGVSSGQFHVVEGSGLSRENRLTPDAVLQVLKAFRPFMDLLPEEDGIRVKTGTLAGVYSLAGYLPGKDPLYFVIILNQNRSSAPYHSYDEGAYTKRYMIFEEFSTKMHEKIEKK